MSPPWIRPFSQSARDLPTVKDSHPDHGRERRQNTIRSTLSSHRRYGPRRRRTRRFASHPGRDILTTDGTDFGTTFALLLSAGPVQHAGTFALDSTTTICMASGLPAGPFTLSDTIIIADRQPLEASLGQSGSFVNNGSVEVAQRGEPGIVSGGWKARAPST